MSSVSGSVMSETLPDGSIVTLDYNWDSYAGADVLIMRISEDYDVQDILWSSEDDKGALGRISPEWHGGHFSDDDVKEVYRAKFNKIYAQERKKFARKPTGRNSNGKGSGWHKERARHSAAAKKGKK